MQRPFLLFILFFNLLAASLKAQDTLPNTLPNITVKNINGQIIVSWINNYKLPVSTINIQRSYDSLHNYSTVGSVLNPQSTENGYADIKPPYNKMYYRVFIAFEGGTYAFSKSGRPVKVVQETVNVPDTSFPFLITGRDKSAIQSISDSRQKDPKNIQPKTQVPVIINSEIITYPSRRIFTAKDNNVIISLPDAESKRYTVKFFDENELPLFELNKIHESFLIIEKVNFVHAGWFHFEVYESGKLMEKNKFFISKDGKSQPPQN
ncbi:hypothetical protein [Ferruginibacter sp.]